MSELDALARAALDELKKDIVQPIQPGDLRVRDIAESIGIGRSSVYSLMAKMIDSGTWESEIVRDHNGNQVRVYRKVVKDAKG